MVRDARADHQSRARYPHRIGGFKVGEFVYRRVQRSGKQGDQYEGPFLIEQESAPGIYQLRTDKGLVRARAHFLKRSSPDGIVRSPDPAVQDLASFPTLNESPIGVDDQVDELGSLPRRSRRNVGHSNLAAQWGIVGDDDLAQSDYEDTGDALGAHSDLEILDSPKKRGKRKRKSGFSKKAKRQKKF